MAEAEHALGKLDATATLLPTERSLVRCTQLRDAQSSASLDGLHLGLEEILVADLWASQGSVKRPDLLPRVTPYLRTYHHGIRRIRAGAPVDAALMIELSAIMTGQTDRAIVDTLRSGPSLLGDELTGPYLVTAVGPHLLDGLEQLSNWAGGDHGQPRVAHLAITHYQLEVLAPFPATVNAHMARESTMLHLIRQGLLHDQILPLSVWFDSTRDEYHRQIRTVVDTGLIHPWIEYVATAIRDQANAQLTLISGLNDLADEFANTATMSHTTRQVLIDLIGYPVINHRAIQERYKVTARSASNVTRRLIELNILTTWETPQYNQAFLCEPVLNLLT
ncbi:hypothetical protein AOZ06_05305 [Kibdelosporangium phytohabitans]|uniref:Fic/DOC N-terminal domain-containing protein n=1 Tax=Kibdelosporangium phytohabitans TaxID=860235 RepID=A0A0N9HP59_9PSEU|nr:hypothetical protein AOZ06_05305 [Kibdelosporangium phytohabitans]